MDNYFPGAFFTLVPFNPIAPAIPIAFPLLMKGASISRQLYLLYLETSTISTIINGNQYQYLSIMVLFTMKVAT